MSTNVKPGDMAMIIRAYENYQWTLGRPVRIKKQCCMSQQSLVIWQFEQKLVGPNGSYAQCAYDRCLKRIDPLSDDDGVKVGIFDDIPVEGPVVVELSN